MELWYCQSSQNLLVWLACEQRRIGHILELLLCFLNRPSVHKLLIVSKFYPNLDNNINTNLVPLQQVCYSVEVPILMIGGASTAKGAAMLRTASRLTNQDHV